MARTKKTTPTIAPTETVDTAPVEEMIPKEAPAEAVTEPEMTPSLVEPESEIPPEEVKASTDDNPLPEESDAKNESEPPEESDAKDEPRTDDGKTRLAISLPIEPFKRSYGSLQRLKDLIGSKETLLKVALGTEDLSFTTDDEKVSFPWFTLEEPGRASDEVDAYTKLIVAMARKAVTQSRVSGKEKPNPDPRLAMRLFLINLGFIGDEFKSARAILLRNFKAGNSSMNFSSDFPEAFPIITVLKEDHHV